MTYQHKQTVRNLLLRGWTTCVVCKGDVDITDDLRIIMLSNAQGRRRDNMRLRHAACVWSKYQPRPLEVTLDVLVELMVASEYKMCSICKQSWVGSALEDLTVGRVGGVKAVLHKVCL